MRNYVKQQTLLLQMITRRFTRQISEKRKNGDKLTKFDVRKNTEKIAPEISKHPRNITILKGENVIFRCSVVGNPTPSVVWKKNGKELDVTADSRLKLSSKKNNHSLEIAEVHFSDSGKYMCVANNSVSRSSSSAANLTVQYVPDPPKDFKVILRGSRSVNISWINGFNGNSAIQNYTVEISEDGQKFRDAICQGTLSVNACVIHTTRVSIKELFPWTIYYLRVFARNIIGSSNRSLIINVTTDEEVPSSAPPFNVTVVSSTAVNVSWKMLSKQDARGEIQGYYILYKRKNDPQLPWKNRTVNRKETTSKVVTSLKKFTSYEFAIQAFNNKDVSVKSDIIETKTDQDVPSAAPKLMSAEPKNSTSIELTWEPVLGRDLNGILTEYVIRYSHDKEERYREKPNSLSKVVINGLRASTNYSFKISAATIKGEGPQSEPKSATTKDPPIPPIPNDIGTSEVSVAFKPLQILSSGKEVRYYQVIVVQLRKGEGPGKSSDENYVRVIRKYEDRVAGEPYITAEFSNNNERRTTFPVGDGKYYSRKYHIEARRKRRAGFTEYLNGKLDDDTEYAVFQRSLSGPDDYQNEGFTQFTTRKMTELEPEDKTVIVIVVFIVLFIVFVVVVGGIVIVWLRGRRRSNENEVDEDIPMEDRGYVFSVVVVERQFFCKTALYLSTLPLNCLSSIPVSYNSGYDSITTDERNIIIHAKNSVLIHKHLP
ncbi:neogenin-like [Stylophora pistillata]|uniref:neogenin-like n=1 Tax=Stylophora pistillata TaxID=50429 RepID=UPI000C03CD4C|nr:neogenin-like [Stylophora pistillata]